MKKLLIICLMYLIGGNAFVVRAQTKSFTPIIKVISSYQGTDNVNVSLIPRALFPLLENNGLPQDLMAELKKLESINMLAFNKEKGDMGVYQKILADFDAAFTADRFVLAKNSSENGSHLRVYVKMDKDKVLGMTILLDGVNSLDVLDFNGAGDVGKIPVAVKNIPVFQKIGKKM